MGKRGVAALAVLVLGALLATSQPPARPLKIGSASRLLPSALQWAQATCQHGADTALDFVLLTGRQRFAEWAAGKQISALPAAMGTRLAFCGHALAELACTPMDPAFRKAANRRLKAWEARLVSCSAAAWRNSQQCATGVLVRARQLSRQLSRRAARGVTASWALKPWGLRSAALAPGAAAGARASVRECAARLAAAAAWAAPGLLSAAAVFGAALAHAGVLGLATLLMLGLVGGAGWGCRRACRLTMALIPGLWSSPHRARPLPRSDSPSGRSPARRRAAHSEPAEPYPGTCMALVPHSKRAPATATSSGPAAWGRERAHLQTCLLPAPIRAFAASCLGACRVFAVSDPSEVGRAVEALARDAAAARAAAPLLTAAVECPAAPRREDPLFRLWDAQEQLEDVQAEVVRLSTQLAGAHKACELLCSVALNAGALRMQETAALSAHIDELSVQHGAACEALRLQGAAMADLDAAYQWLSAERASVHAALHASLVERARERAASDELRRQLADERAWRQACFGTLGDSPAPAYGSWGNVAA